MSSKLTVDPSKCIVCGSCVAAYPQVFEYSEDGTAVRVKTDADYSGLNLEEVKQICPQGAIVDEEEGDSSDSQ